MAGHFWSGSLCLAGGHFPSHAIAITDTITILEDMSNRIPDGSWMLYLLEVFDRENNIPAELNLICQFNDRDNFWAIFGGVNRYKFTKVLPVVGHSYLRQIVMRKNAKTVEYSLIDKVSQEREEFIFNVSAAFAYEGANHFTGMEWWNRANNSPFPVRYRVSISDLMYGMSDGSEITYRPYNALVPDSDRRTSKYPVLFEPFIKDGCVCYSVADGTSGTGLKFAMSM